MTINITAPLKSRPTSIRPGQSAQLILDLITDRSPSETAQITYTANAPGVVFGSTGTSVLRTSQTVFSTGTTSNTSYSLSGASGAVPISAEVTPATPPAGSGTSVVLSSALAMVGAARPLRESRSAAGGAGRKVARKAGASKRTAGKSTKRTSGARLTKATRASKASASKAGARKTSARNTGARKTVRASKAAVRKVARKRSAATRARKQR